MPYTITVDGKVLPDNCADIERDFPADQTRLWDLFACADALIPGDEYMFSENPFDQLIYFIDHPDFQGSAGSKDWPDLPSLTDWMRANEKRIKIDVAA